MFEGLSTGAEIICSDIPAFSEQLDPSLIHFIPTTEKINMEYMYNSDNKSNTFPIRKSFYVNELMFKNKLENFEHIGKNEERRKMFGDIIDKNSKSIIRFLLNL